MLFLQRTMKIMKLSLLLPITQIKKNGVVITKEGLKNEMYDL